MRKIYDIFLPVVITFLITMVLNTIVEFSLKDNGEFSISNSISIGGTRYVPVTIVNYSNSQIDGLRLSVPINTNLNSIYASYPLQIATVPDNMGTADRKRIIVSGIEVKRTLRLFVPVDSHGKDMIVWILNHTDKKLNFVDTDIPRNPLKVAITKSLQIAVIYSIIFVIFGWIMRTKQEHINSKLDKANVDIEELKKKTSDNIRETNQRCLRHRVLLLARISDYAKELSFWRNTIQRLLLREDGTTKESANGVIKEVTSALKTYSTLERNHMEDFAVAQVLAGLLAKDPNSPAQTQKETTGGGNGVTH